MMMLLPLFVACASPPTPPAPQTDAPPAAEPKTEPTPMDITETRQHEAQQASATVRATVDDEEIRRLAGAEAWRTLAARYAEAEEWDAALASAQGGIDELGRRYRPASVRDDTNMKIFAAEERLAAGRTDHAAKTLMGVLDSRVVMMRDRVSDRLAN